MRGAATALALACETLRRDPAAGGHAAMIEAQLDRLRAGLEELQVARGGRAADARAEAVDVGALTQAAARPWAASFEWEGGPAPANLDRRRFAKALGNVLANAAKHGSGGGLPGDRPRTQRRCAVGGTQPGPRADDRV